MRFVRFSELTIKRNKNRIAAEGIKMPDLTKLITVNEYAKRIGKNVSSVRRKCTNGSFETAIKAGRQWLISPDQEYHDERIKDGSYIGFRERYRKREKPD